MPLDTLPSRPFEDSAEHLEAEFHWLAARIADHVRRLRDEGRFNEDPLRGLYLRSEDVLGDLDRPQREPAPDRLRVAIDKRAQLDPRPPLARIAEDAELDEFERFALLCVAAPALDRRFRTAYAFAQNDAGRSWPSVDLLIELLSPGDRLGGLARFTSSARLMATGLIQFAPGEEGRPLADRALSVDDRVVEAIAGIDGGFDARVAPFMANVADAYPGGLDLPPLDAARPLILLLGETDVGQRLMAAAWCRAKDRGLLVLDGSAALASGMSPPLLAKLLLREALLARAGLMIDARGDPPSGAIEALLALLAEKGAPVIAAAAPAAIDCRLLGAAWTNAPVLLDHPDPVRRVEWWANVVGPEEAEWIGWRTRLGPDAIADFAKHEVGDARTAAASLLKRRLPSALQHVPLRFEREELVLSSSTSRQLDELVAFAAHGPHVLGQWGFGARGPEARRCVALLAGPSGCGKTMAASIVAKAAGLELFRANLAAVYDKYIGETEKGLDRLFSAAADAGIALLFDEADVLFGSRTETRDSHDRYANLSTAYILQRIEQHDGFVLLSSNLPRNMDAAFARRLTHTISFSLPDVAQREELWRRAFPAAVKFAGDLPWPRIAKAFELSGGNIRNASLAAAYLASGDGEPVSLDHVLRAITRELEKCGRTPIAADFASLAPPPG